MHSSAILSSEDKLLGCSVYKPHKYNITKMKITFLFTKNNDEKTGAYSQERRHYFTYIEKPCMFLRLFFRGKNKIYR